MLALQRKCMCERNPRRAKPRVHQRRFAKQLVSPAAVKLTWKMLKINGPEILPRLGPFAAAEIPHADSIPGYRVLWLAVNHLVCENEELGMQVREVVHASYM
jgi:hypothetical protein